MDEGKIKVLHIITRLIIGGAQENTMLTADFLDKDKFEVLVVSGPQTGSEGSIQEEARERGISLVIMPELVREIDPIKDIIALIKLYLFIRKERYEIVHTHSSKAGILGRVAAWLSGTRVIVHTVHGWSFHDQMSRLERTFYVFLEKVAAALCHCLVVVSPRDASKGLAVGIARSDKYVTIRSGIELDRFMEPGVSASIMRKELGIPQNAVVVGTVTRLSPQKAPLDFIAAASVVAKVIPNAWFVMVGDGPLKSEVERSIADFGLDGKVILTGLRRDVPQLLAAFDIFVLSSLWEGLPRVLPQAMAASLPVVATKVDGSAEAVVDGITGFLVPPGDKDALAEKILRLLRDMELAKQMGGEGIKKVPTFGARKMVADIEKLYFDLLECKT